jgi:hypothetical protein
MLIPLMIGKTKLENFQEISWENKSEGLLWLSKVNSVLQGNHIRMGQQRATRTMMDSAVYTAVELF